MEDREAIQRLQYQYGFYLNNRMWHEIVDLFAEDGPSIQIGRRGTYIGKERIFHFMHEMLGQGRWGLLKDEIINHIQLQIASLPRRGHAQWLRAIHRRGRAQ